ncbi:MAG: DUF362 domain-containing protein [Candidatus Omnitrophica bacterium]|nr:DUF362 domain-containing protein [Candidatus Omnitrophota bacterium]MBU1922661.1 DUF362 domain-containing protein [Candidatus Omnitrophota bacterium]
MSAQISVIKCNSYEPAVVEQAVRSTINLLGGITCFVKPGSRVLVKPNLLMSKGPEYAITTHPQVVRSVIRILKEINCQVIIGDGPSAWDQYIENVDKVYEVTGIKQVAYDEGVQLVNFFKRRMHDKFPLTSWLDECDYLINLPKFKTHEITLITGAIKNLFGLVSGTYKVELHKNYSQNTEFAKILVDIYQESKPALTIIDGVLAMEGDGPGTSGKPRQLNLLLGGSDCVALDTIMAKIMGIKHQEVLSTKEAAQRGLGEGQFSRIKIKGEDIDKLNVRPFILPQASKINNLPDVLKILLKLLIKYYPYSLRLKCTHCGHCVNICPKKCIMLKKKGIAFNYKQCIACFCCQEACPAVAIGVKKSLLAKLIGL